jgi:3-dehydroquinate synthase
MTEIRVGDRFQDLAGFITGGRTVMVTDKNVHSLYGDRFPDGPVIILEPGEANKNLNTVDMIYREFLRHRVDRGFTVVGIGGGVVCDITGFAASTYLRGLAFGFVPTTLLCMADASLGGKNGVNFEGLKNHVGTVTQPRFILSDPLFLTTLGVKEIRNGIAEIIKHGLIRSSELVKFLVHHAESVMGLEDNALLYLLRKSVEIKMKIVHADEKESGERRNLNFGHTFGHIFEELYAVSHGEAVAAGMGWAARLSAREGLLDDRDVGEIEKLLRTYGLPAGFNCRNDKLRDMLLFDKKKDADDLWFVFLNKIGQSEVRRTGIDTIGEFIDDMCQSGQNDS